MLYALAGKVSKKNPAFGAWQLRVTLESVTSQTRIVEQVSGNARPFNAQANNRRKQRHLADL